LHPLWVLHHPPPGFQQHHKPQISCWTANYHNTNIFISTEKEKTKKIKKREVYKKRKKKNDSLKAAKAKHFEGSQENVASINSIQKKGGGNRETVRINISYLGRDREHRMPTT
jgi:hypothetical protein